MNLEEAKDYAGYNNSYLDDYTELTDEGKKVIKWLIAEVELMQKQLDFIEEEGEVTATAQRCAEIAESHETMTLSQVARRIKEDIRKEFL